MIIRQKAEGRPASVAVFAPLALRCSMLGCAICFTAIQSTSSTDLSA
jgi:hypothetical protein